MTPNSNDQPFDRSLGDLEPYAPPERNAAAWLVTVPGGTTLAMLGERCKQSEAMRCAQLIWPGATVE
jgi:hypothetical protein